MNLATAQWIAAIDAFCNCSTCTTLDRQFPNDGRQLALLPEQAASLVPLNAVSAAPATARAGAAPSPSAAGDSP